MTMILAIPMGDTIVAEIGEYTDGGPFPEIIIRNERFVDWGGSVARHFVPVDYYRGLMSEGEGLDLYNEVFGDFDYFAFYEHQDDEIEYPFWIDKDNCLTGAWFVLLMKDKEFRWFRETLDAQTFFYWLSMEETQEAIHEQNQLEGSRSPRSVASKIN